MFTSFNLTYILEPYTCECMAKKNLKGISNTLKYF